MSLFMEQLDGFVVLNSSQTKCQVTGIHVSLVATPYTGSGDDVWRHIIHSCWSLSKAGTRTWSTRLYGLLSAFSSFIILWYTSCSKTVQFPLAIRQKKHKCNCVKHVFLKSQMKKKKESEVKSVIVPLPSWPAAQVSPPEEHKQTNKEL